MLYHEIYKKDGMIMYKGRKKGTITYVAISCIEKDQRLKVTNHVRLVYDLVDQHVVRFYEWYETSNHLWLVTDLCVGGSLQQMLTEDTSFPEASILAFGSHLVRGLRFLHSRDVVWVQWHPVRIVLDGGGALKYFDFSDSKKINEDYDELVQRFFGGLALEGRDIDELLDYRRPTAYTAPEVLQGSAPDFLSDVWGLGCLLFEMHTGGAPFGCDKAATADEIVERVLHSPLIIPAVRGSRLSGRASPELTDVLERMLQKNRDARITLEELWQHSFWRGALSDLSQPEEESQKQSQPHSQRNQQRPLTAPIDYTDSADGSASCTVSMAMSAADDASFVLHLGSRVDNVDNVGAVDGDERCPPEGEAVTVSVVPPPDISELQQMMDIATSNSSDTNGNDAARNRPPPQIEDYARTLKDGRAKFDAKLLPVVPLSAVKLRALRRADRDRHLRQLETALKVGEKGPPSQRRLHLLHYLAQLALCRDASDHLLDSGVAMELCRQLRATSNQELIVRLCQALAVMLHHATLPVTGNGGVLNLGGDGGGELLAVLADTLRDHFRVVRVKLAALTAMGEALVRLAHLHGDSDDGGCNNNGNNSDIVEECPSPGTLGLCVTLLQRCLHRSEEVNVNLAAARTIDIVAGRGAPAALVRLMATVDTLQQVYLCYKHAAVDPLKVSAAGALCRLSRSDTLQCCALLERVGPTSLVDNLHVALTGVQEALLQLLATVLLLQPGTTVARKLCTHSEGTAFLRAVMRLMETPATPVRAKALILVLLLARGDLALLRIAVVELRLVLYLERELKRAPIAGLATNRDRHSSDAMERCLQLFTSFLATVAVPSVLQQCVAALAAVQGRRHPSSVQTRALRISLPLLDCLASLAACPALRASLLAGERCCVLLAQLVGHAARVDSGHTALGPATDTAAGPQLLSHVLALAEAACHCGAGMGTPLLLTHLLQPLAALTGGTSNSEVRIIGLKLCGDIVAAVAMAEGDNANSDHDNGGQGISDVAVLVCSVEECLLPQIQQFIIDPDPSAVYLLRLLRNYLQISADQCVAAMRRHEVAQVVVKLLLDHQQRISAAVVLESLLVVAAVAQTSADLLRDCILEVDLVAHLCDTLFEIGDVYHKDELSLRTPKTSELLQAGLDGLYALAKLISDLVKRAMKSKRAPDSDECTARLTSDAEQLLTKGKPLTETVDLLVYTLASADSDAEVVDSATRLLHQVVSLYGGQQIHHGLNEANVQLLCHSLVTCAGGGGGGCNVGGGQQLRTLLRILKRLLASGQLPSPAIGTAVRDAVANVASQFDVQSDLICEGLVNEIKKYLDA